MIKIRGLQKKFGKNQVLSDLDLDIEKPGITAIIGPNGSGKTTLLKCLLGMVLPDAGSVQLEGQEVLGSWAYRNQIVYMPQKAQFPENLRVREVMGMMENLRPGQQETSTWLSRYRLEPYLDKKIGHLSGGTRQKLSLVLASVYEPSVIILDEPTAGLDPVTLVQLKSWLQEQRDKGKFILFTSHILHLVQELADRIVFLLEGRIYFDGSPAELLAITGEEKLEKGISAILEKEWEDHA